MKGRYFLITVLVIFFLWQAMAMILDIPILPTPIEVVGTLLITRFVGFKKFAGWIVGRNTPEKRASKRTAD